jgi:hypothetical protein
LGGRGERRRELSRPNSYSSDWLELWFDSTAYPAPPLQWRNHEQSKKHLERVAELREELIMHEGETLDLIEVCGLLPPLSCGGELW